MTISGSTGLSTPNKNPPISSYRPCPPSSVGTVNTTNFLDKSNPSCRNKNSPYPNPNRITDNLHRRAKCRITNNLMNYRREEARSLIASLSSNNSKETSQNKVLPRV